MANISTGSVVVLTHIRCLGLRLNSKKSMLSPVQRTAFLGVIWDSTTMQTHLYPARNESILAAVARIKLGQAVTVKQFQRLLILMAAASNIFWPAVLRLLQWWLRTKGISPRGRPFHMIKVYTQMPLYPCHVEETLVPTPGLALMASCHWKL